ncbi:MAG: hypothetical protein IJM50_02145 [Lachnospiraceae bacterium]|nr:hypothetical protein [Lachnospiraceae bacterium]
MKKQLKNRLFDIVLVLIVFGVMALANVLPQQGYAAWQNAQDWQSTQQAAYYLFGQE